MVRFTSLTFISFNVQTPNLSSESCIKGHRSSGCQHTDRPLFEVKKKGRPVSQCTNCRELRKTRKLHSKCNCSPADNAQEERTLLAPASSRGKREYRSDRRVRRG